MGEVIVLVQKVHVIGRHQPQPHPLGDICQFRVDHVLLRHMLLYFDKEPIRPEDLQIRLGHLPGRLGIALEKRRWNLATETCAGGDQPLVELLECFLVDTRLAVKPLAIGERRELHQVLIPFKVFRQQQQVIRRLG